MTPAAVFARRQEELEQLQTEFMAAGRGRQVAMAPELLQRIQGLLQLGMSEDVLGQDREELLRLRQDLLSFVDDIEQLAGEDAFNAQIAKAEEQISEIKSLRQVTDTQLTEANATLRRIEGFLERSTAPFAGTFQGGGVVSTTGLGFVHRGETVLPAHMPPPAAQQTTLTVNMPVTVHSSGGDARSSQLTGQRIGEQAWKYIEDAARRRQIPLKLER